MKLKGEFIQQVVAGRLVVVPRHFSDNKDRLITLNKTGELLWTLLEKGTRADEMVSSLTSRYGITEEQAKTDIDRFLNVLRENDLLDDVN